MIQRVVSKDESENYFRHSDTDLTPLSINFNLKSADKTGNSLSAKQTELLGNYNSKEKLINLTTVSSPIWAKCLTRVSIEINHVMRKQIKILHINATGDAALYS